MTAAGYQYVKDRGVMHLFFQGGADSSAASRSASPPTTRASSRRWT